MSDGTSIEWTDATWNVVNGCSVVSPGCKHCYAMKLAGTRLRNHHSRQGLTIDTQNGPVWTGETRFNEAVLLDPIKWKRPRKIFVCAHGDLFHESVSDEVIDKVFAVMALASQHIFQVLTKRPDRMRAYLTNHGQNPLPLGGMVGKVAGEAGVSIMRGLEATHRAIAGPLNNVWVGTSVEDKKRADERIRHLLATPAAVRFLSCEPLLGPIDLAEIPIAEVFPDDEVIPVSNALEIDPMLSDYGIGSTKIDWVICGGESGPGARPMHPDWARSLRDQCAAAGVAFHFKQWGAWRIADQSLLPSNGQRQGDFICVGKKRAGRLLDGVQHDGMPA